MPMPERGRLCGDRPLHLCDADSRINSWERRRLAFFTVICSYQAYKYPARLRKIAARASFPFFGLCFSDSQRPRV
jgi:hypothetical protein